MDDRKLTTRRGPWTFVWHGSRLMDVYHATSSEALDCHQVGAYDFKTGTLLVPFDRSTLKAAADKWLADGCDRDIIDHVLPYC